MDAIRRTQVPEWMWVEPNVREIVRNVANLIGDFDEARWGVGSMFGSGTWKPGARVCAVGAAIELLIDRDVLITLGGSKPLVSSYLYPAYVERFGPTEKFEFFDAITIIMRLNDGQALTFSQIRDVVEEAYDEYNADR